MANDPSTSEEAKTAEAAQIDSSTDPDKAKFPIPKWATRPPGGFHLDVVKNGQLLQKVFIDEKKTYYFGRNPKQVDVVVEHASCSRVHALLIYHETLQRFALVDLGSSHGSFYGKIQLEPLKPLFLEPGAEFHLGASSRKFVIREKMYLKSTGKDDDEYKSTQPTDIQLEQVTEYNTAQNRRITAVPISNEEARRKQRPRGNVAFIEQEDIINPEDVDPTIGRFRNLVTTAIISSASAVKRPNQSSGPEPARKIVRPTREASRYQAPISTTLNITLNAAPDLELYKALPKPITESMTPMAAIHVDDEEDNAPHKKKYAKESWPGRKPQGVF
ncbi:unnamed protein product, partial [Mesorhabditis belari]|uniref:FHA domain-containing protein n=1 Tax=Mesorhabditis belari TaxID=2138241 RepID=A0AAF3FPX1_9BILA